MDGWMDGTDWIKENMFDLGAACCECVCEFDCAVDAADGESKLRR